MGNCTPKRGTQSKEKEREKLIKQRKKICDLYYEKSKKIIAKSLSNKKKSIIFSVFDIEKVLEIDKDIIGEGNYGEVRRVNYKTKKEKNFALKILKKNEENLKYFERELNIMKTIDHPNIIKFCEIYVSKKNFYIVMEHCAGQSLRQYLKKKKYFSERETKSYFFQICQALNYLHNIGIAHRDLKLENFLFKTKKKKILKIIDFGLAKDFKNNSLKSYIGTPYYVSPEIVSGKPYNEKCDEWSLGICLFKMLTGMYPFLANDIQELTFGIVHEDFKKNLGHLENELTGNALALLEKLLDKNPRKRFGVREVLQDSWFDEKVGKVFFFDKIGFKGLRKNFEEVLGMDRLVFFFMRIIFNFYEVFEDYEVFLNIFNYVDYGNTGFLIKDEIERFFKENGYNCKNFNEIFSVICLYSDDYFTFSEFCIAFSDKSKYFNNLDILKFLFQFLDSNNSGFLSISDFNEIYRRFGINLKKNQKIEIEKFFNFDKKEKFNIDFKYFKSNFQNLFN